MKRLNFLYLIILVLVILPYALAWIFQGEDIFSGLLFNPTDGYSYLAKMRQGWEGNWKFYLPYTAQEGGGAYIFLFYLFLGHAAHWFHLSLALMFHIARVLGSIFLIWALQRLLKKNFNFDEEQVFRTMLLVCLGSGLGWMALLWGKILPDFWLAETYPFLSMFANPHFPLGLGLMVMIFTKVDGKCDWQVIIGWAGLGLVLSIILPFGFVIAALVLGIKWIWEIFEKRKTDSTIIVLNMVPGGMWLFYQIVAILNDPVLSQWNTQNITITPPFLDLLVALSPAVLAGIGGLIVISRSNEFPGRGLLIAWTAGCFLLAVIPFGLQRRFLTGIFIPICILAMVALDNWKNHSPGRTKYAYVILLILSLPANLITLSIFTSAGLGHEPELFISKEEASALKWMDTAIPKQSRCLTGAETGLLLPAYSHCRVLYGHPFETIHAVEQKEQVTEFFTKSMNMETAQQFFKDKGIDFVVFNKRDGGIESDLLLPEWELEYSNTEVRIYRVDK
jgi:hypothetical protein